MDPLSFLLAQASWPQQSNPLHVYSTEHIKVKGKITPAPIQNLARLNELLKENGRKDLIDYNQTIKLCILGHLDNMYYRSAPLDVKEIKLSNGCCANVACPQLAIAKIALRLFFHF